MDHYRRLVGEREVLSRARTPDSTLIAIPHSIRRIARRGGCTRLAASVYDEARCILQSFVDNVMVDASVLLEMTGRKTVRMSDVMFALKKQGQHLYAVSN
eukprot:TRINITY_DN3995_c0_g1_i1.p3 TRINITY_DN3995_c0_g1~~TRINITY_DN3995_c0_g1_i1.p3  ORF type:complete len:100 (+),score=31.63 TRINITY_DN3995_c0_g1_i1:652-951(+)